MTTESNTTPQDTTNTNTTTQSPPLKFVVKHWNDLTRDDIYYVLKLRCDVFVVEQDCVYPDVDDKDKKAYHVMGYIEDNGKDVLVVYSRVFGKGDYFDKNPCIGRVVCSTAWRKHGYGHQLLDKAINVLIEHFFTYPLEVTISAQKYLQKFYESHGFKQCSEEYLEDGIPHIEMLLKQEDLTGINQQFRQLTQ